MQGELSAALSLGPHSAPWYIAATLPGADIVACDVSFLHIFAPPKKAQLPGQRSLLFALRYQRVFTVLIR